MPTPMEEYLFDLHGYTVIKGAIDPDHLRAMNDFLDALPSLGNRSSGTAISTSIPMEGSMG